MPEEVHSSHLRLSPSEMVALFFGIWRNKNFFPHMEAEDVLLLSDERLPFLLTEAAF